MSDSELKTLVDRANAVHADLVKEQRVEAANVIDALLSALERLYWAAGEPKSDSVRLQPKPDRRQS